MGLHLTFGKPTGTIELPAANRIRLVGKYSHLPIDCFFGGKSHTGPHRGLTVRKSYSGAQLSIAGRHAELGLPESILPS